MTKSLRALTIAALGAALLCGAATSLNVLRDKRLFSDEYIYTFISIGQFPGEAFADNAERPNAREFWSPSKSIERVRAANHLETSNSFLYEVLLCVLINASASTNSLTIGLLSLVPTWIAALVLYRIVVFLDGDDLRGLAAATLFLVHPQIFFRSVDFRGYALGLMFTQVALYLTVTAIARKGTTVWRDFLLLLAATGAAFSHYNTVPSVLVCWLAGLIVVRGSRGRLLGFLLVWGAVIAAWMYAGAFSSAASPARYRWIALTIQQDPNNFVGLTPRNLVLAMSDLVRSFAGLVLLEDFQYRYQAFTIVLAIALFVAWLRLAFGERGTRSAVDIFSVAYVLAPLLFGLAAAVVGGNVLSLRASYQLWSIPVVIGMFLRVLWSLEREGLRIAALLVVTGSLAGTIYSYNGRKKVNPYDALLTRLRTGDVKEIAIPSYYHAQILLFHGGRRQEVWPAIKVDPICPRCVNNRFVPRVAQGFDAVGRFNEQVEHSYTHRRPIVLSLMNGDKIEIEQPLLFERAY